MDIISLHMNAAQRGANSHPGADLQPGVFCTWVQILHIHGCSFSCSFLLLFSIYSEKNIYTVTIYISSYHDDTVKSVQLQRNGIVGMVGGMHGTCHLGLDFF